MTTPRRALARRLLSPFVAAWMLAGCISNPIVTERSEPVAIDQARAEVQAAQLLDVWIRPFDPGEIPEDEGEARGLNQDIRAAEARFMPIHLAKTIERSGYWGAVRVVPGEDSEGAEVLVTGKILHSDGEQLKLHIEAADARGVTWFQRDYEHNVDAKAYKTTQRGIEDAFQPLYNRIANDLIAHRNTQDAKTLQRIRELAELRFAADMAPLAFGDHLWSDPEGRWHVRRLPARDDPMLKRIRAIRDRDYLLIDTLNAHFEHFYNETWDPYTDWREARADEAAQLREVEESALQRKLLGALAVIGGVAVIASTKGSDGVGTQAAKDVVGQLAVIGGAYAVKTGFDKDEETTIHKEALEELGDSFSQEAKPLVVEVEGETHKLTGSAEAQYAQWRKLLKKIYATETGLPGKKD